MRTRSFSWGGTPLVLGVVLTTASVAQTPGDRPRLMAQLAPGGVVSAVDPSTGRTRQLYRSQAIVRSLTVSPSEQYVAFLEYRRDAAAAFPVPELTVLDSMGTAVRRSARQVHRYAWCCGASRVAFIFGDAREGGPGFSPRGVAMMDVATGAEVAIAGVEYPVDLRWAAFDSSVYIKNAGRVRVYRFHVPSGALTQAPYRDVEFSPAGRFYLHLGDEGDPKLRLYERSGNREVVLIDSTTLTALGGWRTDRGSHYEELRLVGWAFAEGNVLLLARNRVIPIDDRPANRLRRARRETIEHVFYDVASRRVIGRFTGERPPWSVARGQVPSISNGRIRVYEKP